jgi:hypothetical protein
MECSCIIAEGDGPAIILSESYHNARKEHKCCECRKPILKGDKYYKEVAVFDSQLSTYKTCSDCKKVRDAFFCAWTWTVMWEDLWCEIVDSDGDISQTAIAELPKSARDKVCDLIDKYFDQED